MLDSKLKLNHHLTSMIFIANTVCVTCVLKEGQCRNFLNGDWEKSYKHCWHYRNAVNRTKSVLDKYDC